MTWRNIGLIAGVLLLAAAGALWWLSRTAPTLTIATWAGTYGRAQASAMFNPYTEKVWVDVRIAQYDGGLDELRGQVGAHRYDWDAVDLELPDAIAACKEGLLEPMDPTNFPKSDDGIAAVQDFVGGAFGPCWVGSVVYSQVIGFAPSRVKGQPTTIADFFDLRRYPGPRGLRRNSARLNLELALLADGVKPGDIYRTLSTHRGVARALAKLDTIRPFIVWWSKSSEPRQMLEGEKVVFTTMPNSTLFDAAAKKQNIGVIWDNQLYEMEVFGIPRGDPKKPMAMEFLHFATSTQPLAHVAEWIPYGPARKSSLGLVGKNPELGLAMRPFLPTAPEHFGSAFRVDDVWWAAHGREIAPLWQAWMEGASAADLP